MKKIAVIVLFFSLFAITGCVAHNPDKNLSFEESTKNIEIEKETKRREAEETKRRDTEEAERRSHDEKIKRLEAEETKKRDIHYYKTLLFIVSPKSVYYANKSLSSKFSTLKLINTIKNGLDARFQREELTIINYYERKMDLLEATTCIDGLPEKCKIVRQNAMRNLDSLNKSQ